MIVRKLYSIYLRNRYNNSSNKILKFGSWYLYKIVKKLNFYFYNYIPLFFLKVDKESDIIVSLTSIPERIDILHLSIKSILYQQKKAKKVILWLSEEEFPNLYNDLPNNLLILQNCGLVIKFCDNLMPHKKYYYTFKEFPKNRIVTIDDDVYYPYDTIYNLYVDSLKFEDSIIANRVRLIEFTENNEIKPYNSWKINPKEFNNNTYEIFPTGVGGILYKPEFFDSMLYNKDAIIKLCLKADDVWLKANSILSKKKTVYTSKYINPYIEIENSQNKSLFSENVFNSKNDVIIKDVFNFLSIQKSDIIK